MFYDEKKKILTINEHGAYLSKDHEVLIVKTKEGKERILFQNLKKIETINNFLVTKAVINQCIIDDIKFICFSKKGAPLFSFMDLRPESRFLRTISTRLKMSQFTRTQLSKRFVINSIKGKLSFLRYKKSSIERTNSLPELENYISKLDTLIKETKKVKGRYAITKDTLLGLESQSANIYFTKCFPLFFDSDIYCGNRIKENPRDIMNMCLNYSYGILRSDIFTRLINKVINPFDSIYHYQENKYGMFLVFDLMEGFRHTVSDIAVNNLLILKKITNENIENNFLDINARKMLIEQTKINISKRELLIEKNINIVRKYKNNQ